MGGAGEGPAVLAAAVPGAGRTYLLEAGQVLYIEVGGQTGTFSPPGTACSETPLRL